MEIKKVIGKKVLVEISLPGTTSPSGLFIPAKQNFQGTVLAVGQVEHLKVGDKVKYHEHSGIPVEVDGKKCLFLREKEDIIAIL